MNDVCKHNLALRLHCKSQACVCFLSFASLLRTPSTINNQQSRQIKPHLNSLFSMIAVGTAIKYGPPAYKAYKTTAPAVAAAARSMPAPGPALAPAAMPFPVAAVPLVSRPAPKVCFEYHPITVKGISDFRIRFSNTAYSVFAARASCTP